MRIDISKEIIKAKMKIQTSDYYTYSKFND